MMLLSKIKKQIQFAVEMRHSKRECDKEKVSSVYIEKKKVERKRAQIKRKETEKTVGPFIKKCSLFMHKLRSKCRNEAKKISTKLFFGGYRSFSPPSPLLLLWNILVKSNIQLNFFSTLPKPIMHWTRAPYYFIHFVYIRSHGRFIKLDRKWFPVHFSLRVSFCVCLCTCKYLCLYAVLACCAGFFEHPFIFHKIQ